jgi:hypothetical protein
MDLTKCIYENIKDNFYYGLFGDFKLVIDEGTGYFNATKLYVLKEVKSLDYGKF